MVTAPRAAASASRTAPIAGSTSSSCTGLRGRNLREPRCHVAHERRQAAEDAAGEHGRKRVAAHPEARDHRRRRRRELGARARQNLRRRPRRLLHGPLHQPGDAGNRVAMEVAIVDLVNQLLSGVESSICSSTIAVSSVAGPRPSNCRTTADSAARPIQKPPPSSPSR